MNKACAKELPDDVDELEDTDTDTFEAHVSGITGCVGCCSGILLIFIMFAMLLGVTVNGRHYGVSCNTSDGILIETGE